MHLGPCTLFPSSSEKRNHSLCPACLESLGQRDSPGLGAVIYRVFLPCMLSSGFLWGYMVYLGCKYNVLLQTNALVWKRTLPEVNGAVLL